MAERPLLALALVALLLVGLAGAILGRREAVPEGPPPGSAAPPPAPAGPPGPPPAPPPGDSQPSAPAPPVKSPPGPPPADMSGGPREEEAGTPPAVPHAAIPEGTGDSQTEETLRSYLSPGRDVWQMPERVIEALRVPRGGRVADVGAGSGYFTSRLAEAVGTGGKVYALDVDPAALEFLRRRIREEPAMAAVEVKASTFTDVGLPSGSLDLAFMCDVHFFVGDDAGSLAWLESVRRALEPRGRLAVLEARWRPDASKEPMGPDDVARFVERAGFREVERHDFLPNQNFVIFEAGSPPRGSPAPQ